MNVIDFLIQDHDSLRNDALEIRKNLESNIVRDKIKNYISHFELHESVEDRYLLDYLKKSSSQYELESILKKYEENHKKIWQSLSKLMQDSWVQNVEVLKQDFFNFVADVEWHTAEEERVYFPTFSRYITPKQLEDFGVQIKNYYQRFK